MCDILPQLCLGINLGSKSSCISIFVDKNEIDQSNPEVIANSVSMRTTPSYVSFTDDTVLIGQFAKEKQKDYPESTFFSIKRIIGREFHDPYLKSFSKNHPFKIRKNERELPVLMVGNRESRDLKIFPEQITALILSQLYENSRTKSTKPTKNVVITVPANFNERQRRATKDAAKIAGLEPIDVLNEPVAAAIDFAFSSGTINNGRRTNVLVFDFGATTLNVSIVEIDNSKFTVIATAGDDHFGGTDIDDYIFNEQCRLIKERHGKDLTNPNVTNQKEKRLRSILQQKCEEAKINLSYEISTSIEIGCDMDTGKWIVNNVNRAFIDKFIQESKDKIFGPIRQVLEESGFMKTDISNVILVGSSSNIPSVRELIRKEFGFAESPVNPDEAIARGAAIYGAYLLNRDNPSFYLNGCRNIQIQDVTPAALGFLIRDGMFHRCIQRNTPIPCESSWTRLDTRELPFISIVIYEGDNDSCCKNHLIGRFRIVNNISGSCQYSVCWVKIKVDHESVHVLCAKSDTRPGNDTRDYEEMKICCDQSIHTDEEMMKMKNMNRELMH